jgi:hypothetical protein
MSPEAKYAIKSVLKGFKADVVMRYVCVLHHVCSVLCTICALLPCFVHVTVIWHLMLVDSNRSIMNEFWWVLIFLVNSCCVWSTVHDCSGCMCHREL